MSNAALQKAMDNVEASLNMEGMRITDYCKELSVKLIKKEITFEEYMKIIVSRSPEYGIQH